MSKPVLAVDIDEVLSASAPDFVAFSNDRWGTNLTVQDYTEHWAEMWQVDLEEVLRRRDVYIESGLVATHAPITNAYDALKKLKAHYEIVLVTSRSIGLEKDTRAWLEKNYADIADAIYFTGIFDNNVALSAFTNTKSSIFAELKPAFIIDDQMKHCQAAADLGIPALLFGDYPWNKVEGELPENITRCHDWQEVLDILTKVK